MCTSALSFFLTRVVVIASIVGLVAFDCQGQPAARPNRGTMPTGSYTVSDIENISLTNGNVNLSIPLAALPPIAGGKLGLVVRAEYNSKQWDTVRNEVQPDPLEPFRYVTSELQLSDTGGWRIDSSYSIRFESVSNDYQFLQPSGTDPEYNLITSNNWMKVVLITPDGGRHELRPMDYSAYQDDFFNHNYLRGYYKENPHSVNGSMRYYSFDGSRIWAKIDNTQYCCFGPAASWTIYLPDGTKVEQLLSGEQRITDTNGNKVKIFWTGTASLLTQHYQDEQTGREVKVVYDATGNGGQGTAQVQYQTVGGVWQSILINYGTTRVFGKAYEFGDAQCGEAADVVDTQIPVIRSIIYPQTELGQPGKQFTFTYNSDATDTNSVQWRSDCWSSYETISSESHGWGSLSQIGMPSGATVNYSYNLDGQHYLSFNPDDAPREAVVQKTVTHDGASDFWTFSSTPATGGFSASDGSSVWEDRYSSDPGFAHTNAGFGGKEELVYRTTTSNKIMVERHWSLMMFSDADNLSAGAQVVVGFNPVVDAEYTSLLDDTPSHNPVKMSAKTFQYDYNGNLLSETDYDWFDPGSVSRDAQGVPTGVPTGLTPVRVTSNSYYNQASSASSANVYAKRSISTGAPLILNAAQQTTLGPAIVQLSYDGQPYGVAPTAGNLTVKRVWDDLDSKWITTSNTYGLYGNIATSTDGRGKVTEFFYDDSTHALPTRVTVDPQNGTGTQTAGTSYDFWTGLVTTQTDVNGQVTTIDYTNQLLNAMDPFGRPGAVYTPTININGSNQRRRVATTYLDATRKVIVETDLNAENDKLLKTRTTTDMLGRPILSESTEDGTNYTISVRNAYLDSGRVTLTSSPMRSSAATTDSWTRIAKDAAGRVIEVATFGGAAQPAWTGTAGAFTGAVTTAYNANFTTVTDQAGKVRRSMVDALGRLVRVDEPDENGNLGSTASPVQKTDYEYDVFGNLKKVLQDDQQRTFTYDSLSRLRTAINPESGTVTYQYDDNANLLVKTDARGVSAHYEYDSLNRVTRRWYNGSNSTTQTVHNVPALPSGVGATDEAKFFYDSQTLPAGSPTYTRGAAVGRLVAQMYGSGANGDYYAYDVLGRQTSKIQQTGSVNYQMSAGYTLSGAVSSLTYPSGHTISNTFDQAGRLTVFSGNLGDGTTRTYATGSVYSALGSLLKEQFGTNNAVYHKLHYNSRAQLCDVRASNVNDEWGGELGALVNYYSTPFFTLR